MVRANNVMTSPKRVRTPHRIKLLDKKIKKSKSQKRRLVVEDSLMTENEELKAEPIKKIGLRSRPLKTRNYINMTKGITVRTRARVRGLECHKVTEYFKEEPKSPTEELNTAPAIHKTGDTENNFVKENKAIKKDLNTIFDIELNTDLTESKISNENKHANNKKLTKSKITENTKINDLNTNIDEITINDTNYIDTEQFFNNTKITDIKEIDEKNHHNTNITDITIAIDNKRLNKRGKNVKVEEKSETNHKLTEYFPVRRSVRKTSKCVMAEKMRDLEKAVREQREDGLQVTYFNDKGRGVVATRPFARGEFVVEYVGELVGVAEAREREAKYALDPNAGCYMYFFKHCDQQYCIDATAESGRLGRLVNHSRNGNLYTKAVWVDGPRLVLFAAQDIATGDELTYDYGDRSKMSLEHHPWLAL